MLAFWPEKSVIDHPLNYNLYKKKDLIEHDFIRDYGILQKVVYNNAVIGYFVACRIDKEVLMEINPIIDVNLVVGTFVPKDDRYPHELIKLHAKSFIYNSGIHLIKKIAGFEINYNDCTSFYAKFSHDLFNTILIRLDNDYINNIMNQAKAFDNRLARYYKNEKVLVF